MLADGTHMTTITRDTYTQQLPKRKKLPEGKTNTFDLDTKPDAKHRRVYELLAQITV